MLKPGAGEFSFRQSYSKRAPFKHATDRCELSNMLIKKKDVHDYFAARRGKNRLSDKQASAVPPTKSSSVKRANKGSGPADSVSLPKTPVSTQDLRVPFFTSEPGFIGAPPPIVKRRTNS